MVDMVVHRRDLRPTLSRVLTLLMQPVLATVAAPVAVAPAAQPEEPRRQAEAADETPPQAGAERTGSEQAA